MLDYYIRNSKNNIIKNTQELIQIPSVYSESTNTSMPFGENINNALEYILNLGKQLGFRTKNLDGYCGYIEFGKGNEIVGIIGHLDVVPEGEGWTFPPFSGKIYNNKIFGRGSVDDKGPIIASLYAMKYVMENFNIKKRIRLILGLDEERNWDCIKYYKKHEEAPSIGFSPDADFPCIYAEKSIMSCYINMNYTTFYPSDIRIKEINCNNNPLNVVPKFCSTILSINDKKINTNDFIEIIKNIIDENNFEIDIYKISTQEIKLTSFGVQAHAAHPDLGVNAISQLIIVLDKIFKHYNYKIKLFDFFTKYINTEYDGKSLELNFEDESGKLTLNVGSFSLQNSVLSIGLNIRIPIYTSPNIIQDTFFRYCNRYLGLKFNVSRFQPSLHISKDNYLVKTLCDVFNEVTNLNIQPIAIGGATYARAFDNCISFGPNIPGFKDMCHQTDEFIDISALLLCCKIYAKAIIKLSL